MSRFKPGQRVTWKTMHGTRVEGVVIKSEPERKSVTVIPTIGIAFSTGESEIEDDSTESMKYPEDPHAA